MCYFEWDGESWYFHSDTCPKGVVCVVPDSLPPGRFFGEIMSGPCPDSPPR
jgi:hypothetical protein